MSREKLPFFSAASAKGSSPSASESPAVPLMEKAEMFLANIKKMIEIFNHCVDKGTEDERRVEEFVEMIAQYESRCNELIQNLPEITKFGDVPSAKKERGSDEIESIALDDAILFFEGRVEKFFEGFSEGIQENILQAITQEIDKPGNRKNDLKEIKKQLSFRRLLNGIDTKYNTKIDILLTLHYLARAIIVPSSHRSFEFHQGQDQECSEEGREDAEEGLEEGSDPAALKFEDISLLLTEADVLDAIAIPKDLFPQDTCNYSYARNCLQEFVVKIEKHIKLFEDIKPELEYIQKGLEITGEEKKQIFNFLELLAPYLGAQKRFYEEIRRLHNTLPPIQPSESELPDDKEKNNQKAIDCFLAMCNSPAFKEQRQHLLPLINCAVLIEALFERNKSKCKAVKDSLKTITGTAVAYKFQPLFVQLGTHTTLLSQAFFKEGVTFRSKKDIAAATEAYKQLSYTSTIYQHMDFVREQGYIRPIGLKELLEELNPDKDYSLTQILMRPKVHAKLTKAFLQYLGSNNDAEQKLYFFKKLYRVLNPRRRTPMQLKELMSLRAYFQIDNPLGLSPDILSAAVTAFETEESKIEKIGHIIKSLMPVLNKVHAELAGFLVEFKYSVDITDILLHVPEVKDRLNGAKTLAVLDKENIAQLPNFWRDVFIHEKSALARNFSEKKEMLQTHPMVGPELVSRVFEHKFYTNDIVVDSEYGDYFFNEIERQFILITQAVDAKIKKQPRYKNFFGAAKQDYVADQKAIKICEKAIEKHQQKLMGCLAKGFEEKFALFKAKTENFQRREKDSYSNGSKMVGKAKHKICKSVLEELKRSEEFIGCVKKAGNLDATVSKADSKEKEKFCSLIKKKLDEKIRLYFYKESKQLEQYLFIETRNAMVEALINKEVDRQVDLLDNAKIFHPDCLIKLRENKSAIYKHALMKMNLSEKSDQLFLPKYIKILLEIPCYVIQKLPKFFAVEAKQKKNILHSELVGENKQSLSERKLKELLSAAEGDYKNILSDIPATAFVFRLFNFIKAKDKGYDFVLASDLPKSGLKERTMYLAKQGDHKLSYLVINPKGKRVTGVLDISVPELTREFLLQHKNAILAETSKLRHTQNTSGLDLYENIKKKICAAKSEKIKASVASDLWVRKHSLLAKKDKLVPGSCSPTPTTTIGITITRESFQSLVRNVDEEITADSGKRWGVEKYIRHDNEPLNLTPCDDPARCNYIKVYESKDLVFTAQMQETKTTPLPGVDISVTAYRHQDSDVAKSVKHIVRVMDTTKQSVTKKPTLDIGISGSAPEEEMLDLIGKYVREALVYDVLPRVKMGSELWKSDRLEEILQKEFPHFVKEYRSILEQYQKQNRNTIFASKGSCAGAERKKLPPTVQLFSLS